MKSQTTPQQPTFASRWMLHAYALLVLLRVACAFAPGYVHPDEWFQYGEVLGGDLFGIDTLRTWEFNPSFPCRSMASIRLWGLPLVGLAGSLRRESTATKLFLVQRLTFLLLSFIVDASLSSILQQHSPRVRRMALLHFASSGALLGLGLRPFSNNAELVVLSVVMALERLLAKMLAAPVKIDNGVRWHTISALLGAFVSVGVFARFTFAVFAAPVGISYVRLCVQRASLQARISRSLARRAITAVAQLRWALLAFLAVSLTHIVFDSWYYASRVDPNIGIYQALVHATTIAPLNSIRYNRQQENLAQHGIHPRWLHMVVNAPMVMGVVSWFGVVEDMLWRVRGRASKLQGGVATLSVAVIVVSVGILSIQPHQEPRFLLPLLLPASLHYGIVEGSGASPRRTRRIKFLRTLGIAQLVAMVLLLNFLHQAGTLPAMLHLSRSLPSRETDVVFWRSFMPPRHLMVPASMQQQTVSVRVLDLGSASIDQLSESLAPVVTRRKVLFAPMWAVIGLQRGGTEGGPLLQPWMRNITASSVDQRFFPHVDMDHLPECVTKWREGASLVESFSYGVWRV